jgi:homospermidine synthase
MSHNLNFNKLPKRIIILGYGAIGKCLTDILLKHYKHLNLLVCDVFDQAVPDPRFQYLKMNIDRNNIDKFMDLVKEGDMLFDLTTNIYFNAIWPACVKKKAMYLNAAMEDWVDSEDIESYPTSEESMYKTSEGYQHDVAMANPIWNNKQGTTSVFEHGMNPGLVNHFAKQGILDAAKYFLNKPEWTDINHEELKTQLHKKNYKKLAQVMGLHTIHCSEVDRQYVKDPPKDLETKFYNTWSCRGFLNEGLIPVQAACGSHEDKVSDEFPRVNDGKTIMSWAPSNQYTGKFFYN